MGGQPMEERECGIPQEPEIADHEEHENENDKGEGCVPPFVNVPLSFTCLVRVHSDTLGKASGEGGGHEYGEKQPNDVHVTFLSEVGEIAMLRPSTTVR